MMYSVYKIQNTITQEVYIGMTQYPERRWYAHKHTGISSNRLLSKSIKEHGIDKFVFEVLESEIEKKDSAKEIENKYIFSFNSLSPNGFNICMNGGKSMYYKFHTALGTDF